MFGAQITADPLTWLNLGVLGALSIAAIRGLVWFKPGVDRLQSDLDRALADLRRLEELDREVIIPALTKATELMQRLNEEIRQQGGR